MCQNGITSVSGYSEEIERDFIRTVPVPVTV